MKRTIVISLLMVTVAATVLSLGTFAYFSDSASSTGNTFSSGTLDLKLSDADETWANGVNATWSSPANWAPGQEVDATINLRNDGSIPAYDVPANWTNLSDQADPNGLSRKIQVTWMEDSTWVGSNYVSYFVNKYDHLSPYGNNDGKLSLYELAMGDSSGLNSVPGFDLRFYCTENGVEPDPNFNNNGGHNCLNPGGANSWWDPANPFSIRMKFKFMEDADNTYQGKTASFDLNLVGRQKQG